MGAKPVVVPMPNLVHDLNKMHEAISSRTKLIFLPSPNNPTGTYINKQDFNRLIDGLPKDVIVVYDEVYFHFVDALDFPYAKDYIKEGRNLIGLHTFSKIYGLAGMRVGYGITTPEIGEYLNKIFRPFRISTLSTIAAYEALKDTEHVRKSQEMVWEGKRWFYQKFDELGVQYWPTQGNFIMFKIDMNSLDFTMKMLDEGVMVRPGDNFGALGCIRLTIGTQEANERFMEVFKNRLS